MAGLPGAPFDGGAGTSRTDLDYRRRVADSETAGATRIAGCAGTQTGSLRGPRLSGDHPATRPLWARSDRNDGCCARNQADSSDGRARHRAMVERSDRRARSKPDPSRRQCRPTRGPRRFHDSSSTRQSRARRFPARFRCCSRSRAISASPDIAARSWSFLISLRSCNRQDSFSESRQWIKPNPTRYHLRLIARRKYMSAAGTAAATQRASQMKRPLA